MEENYFKISGDKLIFRYVDNDDYLHAEFCLEKYKEGKEKLNGNGNCELLGQDCSMKIFSRKNRIDIVFSGCNKDFFIDGLEKKTLV